MHTHKILNIASPRQSFQDLLSKELNISRMLAQILSNRGIMTVRAAEEFLNPRVADLSDPYMFCDMHKAVDILEKARQNKERVMVFSDYDVDGLTSLALLEGILLEKGLDVSHYIPNRVKEGYGLKKNIMNLVKQRGIKVLITADCGTNSDEEIRELKSQGVRVIVTDHHEPSAHVTGEYACALINPKIKMSGYPYRDLAGVGVAYKLCQAVAGRRLEEELDLVALGTIADAVPLTGENRIIAKEGLRRLSSTHRPGIKMLMETCGLRNKPITPGFVSFILGPRINASGRMDNAEIALDLLMSSHREEAQKLAQIVETHNRQRQKVESTVLGEAQELINKEVNFKEHNVMVVAKEGWHAGVLGIVAAKLAERFYRPAILISLSEELCKGSGRSIKNFHLFEAILECRDLLESFGGHQYATGISITRENIGDFREKINRLAKERLTMEDLLPSMDIDMEIDLSQVSLPVIEELKRLEPYGTGNPAPLFFTRNLKLKGQPRIMGRETLKFWLSDGKVTVQAIGFGMAGFQESILHAESLDAVYTLQVDSWQGLNSPLLEIKELFFK